MNSCGISKMVLGLQVRKLGKERTSALFPISSTIKWRRAKSSKISMCLLCLLLSIWFCESFCWKTDFTWSTEKPGDKSLSQRTLWHFTSLHLHERRQVSHRLCLGWMCWQDCHDSRCNSTASLPRAICSHCVLWCLIERYRDYRTKGLVFSKRTSFIFYHRWMERKLQQWRKFRIQMSTNLEYKFRIEMST